MNFTRWLAKHPKLFTRLNSLILITAFSVVAAIVLKLHPLIIVGIDLGIILLVYITVFMVLAGPIARAERKFKRNCDPEPLISELRFQLTAPKGEVAKREIALDLAQALSDFGQSSEAIEIMEDLAEAKNSVSCEVKFAYHAIYAHILHSCERNEGAENEYSLAIMAYEEIAKKQNVSEAYAILEAEHSLRISDYKNCIAILENFSPSNLREEIIAKACLAYAYISMEDKENASTVIKFILNNGNKLRYVADTKRLIEKMQ